MASQFKLSRGARPLLFERLCAKGASAVTSDPLVQTSPRLLDEKELRASVARELSDLLNTRAPVPIELLEARARSAIDYGIPDFSAFPMGENDATIRLERHVRQAILTYEPRITDPKIEIARGVGTAESISIVVRGGLQVGMMRVPVVFRFSLGTTPNDDAV